MDVVAAQVQPRSQPADNSKQGEQEASTHGGDGSSQRRLAVINVSDGTNVAMWLRALESAQCARKWR